MLCLFKTNSRRDRSAGEDGVDAKVNAGSRCAFVETAGHVHAIFSMQDIAGLVPSMQENTHLIRMVICRQPAEIPKSEIGFRSNRRKKSCLMLISDKYTLDPI